MTQGAGEHSRTPIVSSFEIICSLSAIYTYSCKRRYESGKKRKAQSRRFAYGRKWTTPPLMNNPPVEPLSLFERKPSTVRNCRSAVAQIGKLLIALLALAVALPVDAGHVLVIDDHFANGDLATNPVGIGSGFENTSQDQPAGVESWALEQVSSAFLGSKSWAIGSILSLDAFPFFSAAGATLTYEITSMNYVAGALRNWGAIGLASNGAAFIWDSAGAGDQHGLFLALIGTASGPYDWAVYSRVNGDNSSSMGSGSFTSWAGGPVTITITASAKGWSFVASDGTSASGNHAPGFWDSQGVAHAAAGVQRGDNYNSDNVATTLYIDRIAVLAEAANTPPGLVIDGKKKIVTSRKRVVIKGEVSDDGAVARVLATYKKVKPDGRKIKVTKSARLGGNSWKFILRTKEKRTKLLFQAVDVEGLRSQVQKVKVIRKP